MTMFSRNGVHHPFVGINLPPIEDVAGHTEAVIHEISRIRQIFSALDGPVLAPKMRNAANQEFAALLDERFGPESAAKKHFTEAIHLIRDASVQSYAHSEKLIKYLDNLTTGRFKSDSSQLEYLSHRIREAQKVTRSVREVVRLLEACIKNIIEGIEIVNGFDSARGEELPLLGGADVNTEDETKKLRVCGCDVAQCLSGLGCAVGLVAFCRLLQTGASTVHWAMWEAKAVVVSWALASAAFAVRILENNDSATAFMESIPYFRPASSTSTGDVTKDVLNPLVAKLVGLSKIMDFVLNVATSHEANLGRFSQSIQGRTSNFIGSNLTAGAVARGDGSMEETKEWLREVRALLKSVALVVNAPDEPVANENVEWVPEFCDILFFCHSHYSKAAAGAAMECIIDTEHAREYGTNRICHFWIGWAIRAESKQIQPRIYKQMSDYADSPGASFYDADPRATEGLRFGADPIFGGLGGPDRIDQDDDGGLDTSQDHHQHHQYHLEHGDELDTDSGVHHHAGHHGGEHGGAGGLTGVGQGDGGHGGSSAAVTAAPTDLMEVDPKDRASSAAAGDQQTTLDGTGLPLKILDLPPQPSSATKHLVPQPHEIIIPSYAVWFNISRIHDNERKALPEFFNNKNKSKTPQVYKDYRDFMINTYRLNPTEYLTVTACRRNLAGDVCAIVRVHAFLEQWGLINYQVDPDSRPSTVGPAFTGHFRVTADTPRGLQSVFPAVPLPKPSPSPLITKTEGASTAAATLTHQQDASLPTNLALSKNIYAPRPATPPTTKPRVSCTTCGVDCTLVRYHSSKPPPSGLDLCPNCYLEGRFPSSHFSGDFLKVVEQTTKHGSDEEWNDQETLLLLEGLEMYEDDWGKISEHVGTRTREQCVVKFLRLPIEEKFGGKTSIEEVVGGTGTVSAAEAAVSAGASGGPAAANVETILEGLTKKGVLGAGENPVLGIAAFLAGLVPRDVAEAASKAAVQKVEEGKAAKIAAKGKGKGVEGGAATVSGAQGQDDLETGSAAGAGQAGTSAATQQSDVQKPTEDAMNIDQDDSSVKRDFLTPTPIHATSSLVAPAMLTTGVTAPTTPEPQHQPTPLTQPPNLTTTAAAALGAAAAKSYTLAKLEETEMQKLTSELVKLQLEKMQIKMRHFEELEGVLEWERREVEKERRSVWEGRVALQRRLGSLSLNGGVESLTGTAATTSPVGGMAGGGVRGAFGEFMTEVGSGFLRGPGTKVVVEEKGAMLGEGIGRDGGGFVIPLE
ncbi:hypothetical protein HDV00_005662 [Rhizophlyctis rosea]|nr:hypothetical protein HDV00_005662 [Rhizophlyctis rosea]